MSEKKILVEVPNALPSVTTTTPGANVTLPLPDLEDMEQVQPPAPNPRALLGAALAEAPDNSPEEQQELLGVAQGMGGAVALGLDKIVLGLSEGFSKPPVGQYIFAIEPKDTYATVEEAEAAAEKELARFAQEYPSDDHTEPYIIYHLVPLFMTKPKIVTKWERIPQRKKKALQQ